MNLLRTSPANNLSSQHGYIIQGNLTGYALEAKVCKRPPRPQDHLIICSW